MGLCRVGPCFLSIFFCLLWREVLDYLMCGKEEYWVTNSFFGWVVTCNWVFKSWQLNSKHSKLNVVWEATLEYFGQVRKHKDRIYHGLSKHQNISSIPVRKVIFFCAAILHPLWAKMFKSETTSFQYFSPKILKIQKVWTLDFGKWGQKDV